VASPPREITTRMRAAGRRRAPASGPNCVRASARPRRSVHATIRDRQHPCALPRSVPTAATACLEPAQSLVGRPGFTTSPHSGPWLTGRPGAGGSCSRRRCPSVTLSRRRDPSLGRGSGSPLRDRAGERGGREQQRRHGDPSCDCLILRLRSRAGDHPARRRPPLFSTRPTHVRARESIAVRPTAPVRSHSRGSLRPRARRAAALPPPRRCPSLERPGRRSPACPPAATRRRRGPRRGRA